MLAAGAKGPSPRVGGEVARPTRDDVRSGEGGPASVGEGPEWRDAVERVIWRRRLKNIAAISAAGEG